MLLILIVVPGSCRCFAHGVRDSGPSAERLASWMMIEILAQVPIPCPAFSKPGVVQDRESEHGAISRKNAPSQLTLVGARACQYR